MEELFYAVLNMSFTASLVIVTVMAVRLLLKRAPKIYSYALWSVVLFRLLCPVSLSAPISLLGAAEVPAVQVAAPQNTDVEALTTRIQYVSISTPQVEHPTAMKEDQPGMENQRGISVPSVLSLLWLTGAAIMALASFVSYLRLRRSLVGSVLYRGNVYLADNIPSAFVMGILIPKIYLPSDTPHRERQYIITHERHHIRRLDHIVKWLAYLALCLHWFNPLVWAAFLLAGKDMEMSCDEAVIKRLGEGVRADYSASLLRLSAQHRMVGTPLSFGEGDTRGRVMNMARWKRPKLWVSVLCIAICLLILAACAVNPKGEQAREVQTYTAFDGALSLSLPGDYVWVQNEDKVTFLRDGTVVGGIDSYQKPGFELIFRGAEFSESNLDAWLNAMGVPDASDPELTYMAGNGPNGIVGIEFVSEFPVTGEKFDPDHAQYHTFFVSGERVYDVWLEEMLVEQEVSGEILESVKCKDQEVSVQVTYGSIRFTLPDGVSVQEEADGKLALIYRTQVVGGIYSEPGKTLAEASVPEHWADLEYTGSSSTSAGDYLYWVQKDGETCGMCYVVIYQEQIYYIWHDPRELNINRVEALVSSIEPADNESVPKQEAVQGSDVHTDLELLNYTGSFTSSDGTVEYIWNLQNQVMLPKELPTVEVSQRTLTAEEVQRIAQTLFEGAVFYQPEDMFEEEYSKAELQKKLDLWEHYTDEENLAWLYPDRAQPGDSYISDEADLVRQFLEEYSAMLETAPEEKNDTIYDWVYRNNGYGNGYWTQFEYNGIPYQFHSDGTEVSLYIYSGAGPSTIEDDHYEAILTRTEQPTQAQVDVVRAKVENLIQTIDMGSWQITNCYIESAGYAESLDPVAQYKIIVDAQPVFQGTESIAWGANDMWSRQGMHLEYAPNGQLMGCWLQSFYNLENMTQAQVVPDLEEVIQMAQTQLIDNTRTSFGMMETILTNMEDEEKIICKVTITDLSVGLLLTNHPANANKMRYLPGVIFQGSVEYCGAETGEVYITKEQWTGGAGALQRILAMDLTDGSIIAYPGR